MIKPVVERLKLADLIPQAINARYMTHSQYATLVDNLKEDGALTSVPLVHRDETGDHILSGHHRVKAAIEAGIEEADCMVVNQPLTRQQQVALQISHNSIAGEDDPATLKTLYEELEDVDWRRYSGLDDKTLELLEKIDMTSLSEANLDFATVTLVFLPHELERAEQALTEAKQLAQADQRWLASHEQYNPTLDALQTAHTAWNVGNVAVALQAVLDVFENHLTDTQQGFLNPDTGEPSRKGQAPIEAILGTRTMPADAAAILNRAINRMVETGDVQADMRWKALELLAAEWLSGN